MRKAWHKFLEFWGLRQPDDVPWVSIEDVARVSDLLRQMEEEDEWEEDLLGG